MLPRGERETHPFLFSGGSILNVKELIEKLCMFPEDQSVFVDGYEGGFSEISSVQNFNVKLNVNKESYNGPHHETDDADTPAIVIRRQS